MADYQVGGLSQLIGQSSDVKELDDLFKATSKPEIVESSVIDIQQSDSIAAKNDVDLENDNTDEGVEKSQKFNQLSRNFQINNEEKNKTKVRDKEQEERTIFIGNLPSNVSKKTLNGIFAKIGKIETIRLRGAARPDLKTTKKQAIIQRSFHENRHNIIAYIRYTDIETAKKALKLNGSKIEENIIRVDLACGNEDSNVDQSKAIFVGNLGFSTEEQTVHEHFEKCGEIISVRIVRDSKTGIGKGFCYVNFKDLKSVAKAVDLMNNTSLSGRKLRVSKSVNRPKKTIKVDRKNLPTSKKSNVFIPNKKNNKKNNSNDSKVKKMKKKFLKPSFEGKNAATDASESSQKKKNKKKFKGERQRKLIAKKLAQK